MYYIFLLQLKAQKVSVGSVGVLLTMPIVNHQWRQSPLAMSPRAIYVLLALGCPVLMFLSINFLLWSSGRLSCCLRVAFIHCYTSDSSWNQLKCLRQRIHAADFVCQNTGEAFSARVGGSMVSCRFAHILYLIDYINLFILLGCVCDDQNQYIIYIYIIFVI